ncbi:MAG: 50S ribosomal protein L15 [Deltaproteobacteria bacterium]|nr:50S ribosomal protein L15 [Deltaproteobacteria bacterium]
MRLNELSPPDGSRRTRKRLGRGVGSGRGKTAGRGTKGHNSRSGGGVRPGFEGGQMPLHRRLPKRGFTNIFKKKIAVINIRDLTRFESGSVVDEAALIRAGLVKGRRDGIKLLGHGEIDIPLTIKVNEISQNAREKIVGAGGNIEVD